MLWAVRPPGRQYALYYGDVERWDEPNACLRTLSVRLRQLNLYVGMPERVSAWESAHFYASLPSMCTVLTMRNHASLDAVVRSYSLDSWRECVSPPKVLSTTHLFGSGRVRLFWCNGAPQGMRRAGLA